MYCTPRAWPGPKLIQAIAKGAWRGKSRHQIRSSGYVVDTLEAALWAVAETGSFADAVILAVNLGDDADTVGAVTGQLAGALYGAAAIPPEWLETLAWKDEIVATRGKAYEATTGLSSRHIGIPDHSGIGARQPRDRNPMPSRVRHHGRTARPFYMAARLA